MRESGATMHERSSHRRLGPARSSVTLAAVALLLLSTWAAWGALAAEPAARPGPVLLALTRGETDAAGTVSHDILFLDAREGTVLSRVSAGETLQAFLAPRGDRAALVVLRPEPDSAPDRPAPATLEVRSLPTWELLHTLPLDWSAPPLAPLAASQPAPASPPSLLFASFTDGSQQLVLAFFTSAETTAGLSVPELVVTMFDLRSGRWADWAAPLGPSSFAWLFPQGDRLVVVSRTVLLQWTGTLGTVYALDTETGRILAERAITPLTTAYRPFRGQQTMRTTAGLVAAFLHGGRLQLVTEDLASIVLDPRTLAVERVGGPLFQELAATSAVPVGDRIVARTRQDELLVIDPAGWTLEAVHRLPRAREVEVGRAGLWVLVGSDATNDAVYLLSRAEYPSGCLYRWEVSTAALSSPIVCDLEAG